MIPAGYLRNPRPVAVPSVQPASSPRPELFYLPFDLGVRHSTVIRKHGADREWHRCRPIRTETRHAPVVCFFNNWPTGSVLNGSTGVIQNEPRCGLLCGRVCFRNISVYWHFTFPLRTAPHDYLKPRERRHYAKSYRRSSLHLTLICIT